MEVPVLLPQRSVLALALLALAALPLAAGPEGVTVRAKTASTSTSASRPPHSSNAAHASAPSAISPARANAPSATARPAAATLPQAATAATPKAAPSPQGRSDHPAATTTTPATPPPSQSDAGALAAATAAQSPGTFVLGYYVEWQGSGSAQDFAAHASQLSAIAPLWFSLHSDGSLHLRGLGDIAAVTAQAHAAGKKVLALVTNDGQGAILVNPSLRSLAVRNLVQAVMADHLDGVNIDFESIDGSDAQGLDAFVADVAARLRPLGLLTTVAVGPRASTNIPVGDPSDAYDYAALGQSADYVVLMTYDEHGPGTAPGPVAGIGFVTNVVNYALREMPARKILLGVAGYGYDFAQPGTPTVTAKDILASPPGPLGWDPVAQEALIVSPGHDIWLEDSRADGVRFALAKQDGLGGVALWYRGQRILDAAERDLRHALDVRALRPVARRAACAGAQALAEHLAHGAHRRLVEGLLRAVDHDLGRCRGDQRGDKEVVEVDLGILGLKAEVRGELPGQGLQLLVEQFEAAARLQQDVHRAELRRLHVDEVAQEAHELAVLPVEHELVDRRVEGPLEVRDVILQSERDEPVEVQGGVLLEVLGEAARHRAHDPRARRLRARIIEDLRPLLLVEVAVVSAQDPHHHVRSDVGDDVLCERGGDLFPHGRLLRGVHVAQFERDAGCCASRLLAQRDVCLRREPKQALAQHFPQFLDASLCLDRETAQRLHAPRHRDRPQYMTGPRGAYSALLPRLAMARTCDGQTGHVLSIGRASRAQRHARLANGPRFVQHLDGADGTSYASPGTLPIRRVHFAP